jgi:hypothetical protein
MFIGDSSNNEDLYQVTAGGPIDPALGPALLCIVGDTAAE